MDWSKRRLYNAIREGGTIEHGREKGERDREGSHTWDEGEGFLRGDSAYELGHRAQTKGRQQKRKKKYKGSK